MSLEVGTNTGRAQWSNPPLTRKHPRHVKFASRDVHDFELEPLAQMLNGHIVLRAGMLGKLVIVASRTCRHAKLDQVTTPQCIRTENVIFNRDPLPCDRRPDHLSAVAHDDALIGAGNLLCA